MTAKTKTDWNPEAYNRFRGLRLRPAIDLLATIGEIGTGNVVDLGCGNGAVGAALAARFPTSRIIGIDNSDAMLADADETGDYQELIAADIAEWTPDKPPSLIFSNAALQWVPDHSVLLPRLINMLGDGGVLAVQIPHQNNAPSHRIWVSLVEEKFPGRVDMDLRPSVLEPAAYYHLLAPFGKVSLWETDYFHQLDASPNAHPVRLFTQSTFARPILAALSENEQSELISAYETVMEKVYPRADDGSILFPFRRLFFTLTLPKG